MRIGIDLRYLSHGLVGGVHHYVAQFVPALVRLAPDRTFVLYADRCRPFELTTLPVNASVRILPWRNPLSSLVNDLLMPRWMGADKLDVVHFPANYGFGPAGSRKVVTVHDAINVLPLGEILRGHPKRLRTMAMMTYLHLCSVASLRTTALVLTVSEDAAGQIAGAARFDRRRILVVPHGVERGWGRVEDVRRVQAGRIRWGITRPFVLADAIKNPAALVQAWQLLPAQIRDQHEIVFFSRFVDVDAAVRGAVETGMARLVVHPSRDELNVLFTLASAFVFPSWMEGFGLPVLEAMACGTPVIGSDRGSIPEVAGEAALFADAQDAGAFARHIQTVLTDPGVANRLRSLGLKRSAEFTWERTARGILEAYDHGLAAHDASPAFNETVA
jgi:glycosyltransferase involved in cell wall biosynthesis